MRGKGSRVGALAVTALLLAGVNSAPAEEALVLPRMVVTGVTPEQPGRVVTDPRLPRQPVPASDGADYLQTIPGFSALRSGGVNGDPVFRGMFGSRLGLLTQGGEMLGACPSRMDAPSSYINPESYDQLIVIKGPQSVQWGPGNSAATVLFERGPERFDEPGVRLDANLLAGSNHRLDRSLDAAMGNRQGYLRLQGKVAREQDYQDGDGRRVPSRWRKWNADVTVGWMPSERTLLELTGGTGDGEARYAGRGMDGTRFRRESLGLHAKQEGAGEVWQQVEGWLYYNRADHVMDNYRLRPAPVNPNAAMPMMQGPFASQVERRVLGGRLKSTWQWERLELIAGMDAQQNEHSVRRGPAATYKAQRRDKDAEFSQSGVFVESTWQPGSPSRLVSGLRLDRHGARDRRDQLCSGMGACLANPTAGQTRRKTLASGFFRHEYDASQLPMSTQVGLGYSQRFPDYWELFSATSHPVGSGMNPTGFEPTAFVSGQPERTTQLDLGLHYQQGPVTLWASAYAGRIRDYLLFDYQQSGMMSMSSVRKIEAHIMGAELGGEYSWASDWRVEGSLAHAWGKNVTDGRALPQIPPLEARLSLHHERGRWNSSALLRAVHRQGRVDSMRGNVAGRDFGPSAGFGILSLNTAYRFDSRWKLSVGVDNLLDRSYTEHLNLAGNAGFGYPDEPTRIREPGRVLWARLDLSL